MIIENSSVEQFYYKLLAYLHSLKKSKFVTRSIWTIIAYFIVGVSGLIINSLVGKHYSTSQLGILSQSLAMYQLLSILGNFGIQTSAKKYSTQYRDDKKTLQDIYTSSYLITFISSLFVIGIFELLIYFNLLSSLNVEIKSFLHVLIYGVPFFAINKNTTSFFSGLNEMKYFSIFRISRWIIIISTLLVIIVSEKPLIWLAYAFVGVEVLLFLFNLLYKYQFIGITSIHWIVEHLRFGSKTLVNSFIETFNTKIPILFVGYYLGSTAAGYYSFIEVFAFSIMMISSAIQINFNTKFIELWYNGKIPEIKKLLKKVVRTMAALFVPLFIGIVIFYMLYTYFYMGKDYFENTGVLALLLLGVGIRFLYGPVSTLLVMAGYLNENLFRSILFLLINFMLMAFFIKEFGLIGASIAYLLSIMINMILYNEIYKKKLSINIFKI